ncbi:MAG: rhodanese-like domain-containing protein [Alphaproteobacteria bacterium]
MSTTTIKSAWAPAPAIARAFLILALSAGILVALHPALALADHRMSAAQAHADVMAGKLVLIDIRSPREWRQSGVPQGAKLVTIHHPRGAQGFLEGILKAAGGDKSRPIALICAVGNRSARGKRFLEARGFTNVHDVSEGMFGRGGQPGWMARKLPTKKCPVC